MNSFNKKIITIGCLVFLGGCGGGSGSSDKSVEEKPAPTKTNPGPNRPAPNETPRPSDPDSNETPRPSESDTSETPAQPEVKPLPDVIQTPKEPKPTQPPVDINYPANIQTFIQPKFPTEITSTDQVDEVRDEQIHVVYAVPKGETARTQELYPKIANSIAAWQRWLYAETNGHVVKFDTYQGALDITYVELPRTDKDYAKWNKYKVVEIAKDLDGILKELPSNKKYMVYLEGGRPYDNEYWACGDTQLDSNVMVQYLLAPTCFDGKDFAIVDAEPRYLDYVMIHELVHAEGGVAKDAPYEIFYHLNSKAYVVKDGVPTEELVGEDDLMSYSADFYGRKSLDRHRQSYYDPSGSITGANFANSKLLIK